MIWTFPLKVTYSVLISCIFVVPAIIGYALHLQIAKKSFWALGGYGAVVFVFVMLQLTFASLNRLVVNLYRKRSPQLVSSTCLETPNPSGTATVRRATRIGLAAVGYREEPALFAHCLESMQNLNYPDPTTIAVVIDGDAAEDREMAAVFQKAFPESPVIVLPQLLSELGCQHQSGVETDGTQEKNVNHVQEALKEIQLPTDTTPICFMQPHRGKRHAMYTAFEVLMAAGCEAILSTDSDTKFDKNALLELESALHWLPNTGAVTGDVRIWNCTDTMLSFMSSLRYWMAFNIERAAQSFHRCVTCVSGPMGLYKSQALREVLDAWISQRFLGMECTYGDDRHLTNRVLMRGYRVLYTHHAFCETETPTDFLRWFKQQTRWSKSFYRELLWNAQSLHKHSPWMAAELFYQGIYPFVLLFSIFYILWAHPPLVLLVWLISLMAIACIKTFYSLVVSRSWRFLAFPFYSIYYLFGLVPAKIWAIISLWDVGWGTSARAAAERRRENVLVRKIKESLPAMIWSLLILAGVVFNLVAFYVDPNRNPFLHPPPDPTSIIFFPNPDASH